MNTKYMIFLGLAIITLIGGGTFFFLRTLSPKNSPVYEIAPNISPEDPSNTTELDTAPLTQKPGSFTSEKTIATPKPKKTIAQQIVSAVTNIVSNTPEPVTTLESTIIPSTSTTEPSSPPSQLDTTKLVTPTPTSSSASSLPSAVPTITPASSPSPTPTPASIIKQIVSAVTVAVTPVTNTIPGVTIDKTTKPSACQNKCGNGVCDKDSCGETISSCPGDCALDMLKI